MREEERKSQLLEFFFEESAEGLAAMEAELLQLDIEQPDADKIAEIFRAIHNIKGSGGTFGLFDVSAFAHDAETLLDEIRKGERPLTQQDVDLLLVAGDCLKEMIDAIHHGTDVAPERIDDIARKFREMTSDADRVDATPARVHPAETAPQGATNWRIVFAPHRHLLRTGNEPLLILRELCSLGDLRVTVGSDELPDLDDMDPHDCYLKWDLALYADVSEEDLREVFAWVAADCDLEITFRRKRSDASGPVEAPMSSSSRPDPGIEQATSLVAPSGGSIRVDTDRIDALVNLVGELVITQVMLCELGEDVEALQVDILRERLGQLARNTYELQESVMRIRMLPVSVTFRAFPRLVHDLGQKLGKQVELVVIGQETELDRTLIEKIADPLVHLIRNALDHGLEPADERVAAGKCATGTIHLEARHQGGNIVIEVRDDGAGLDPDRIRTAAIQRGVIREGDSLTDQKLFGLLFRAGFTTTDRVSDISGRGVGLDVVSQNIRELGGSIEVQSKKGTGCAFKIRLPLTLASLDGQLVQIGSETYVIPLISIVESIQIKPELVNFISGRAEIYRLRDEAIPIVRLHRLFGVVPNRRDLEDGLLVVVEAAGTRVGLFVDYLLGQRQVVIKSLAENLEERAGVAGATILSDGAIALIIDVASLVEIAGGQARSNFSIDSAIQTEIDVPRTETSVQGEDSA